MEVKERLEKNLEEKVKDVFENVLEGSVIMNQLKKYLKHNEHVICNQCSEDIKLDE